MVFGDFNNDGFTDVLDQVGNVSGTGITLYVNKGDGSIGFNTIAEPTSAAFGSGPLSGVAFTQVTTNSVYAVDLNGDGKDDIIDAQASAAPKVYQNTGSGFTSVANPFPTQAAVGRFVFGDFNSDGFIDVLNQNTTTSRRAR